MTSTKSIKDMVGRVVLRAGLGDEPGILEVVIRQGRPHAYVTTDTGERIHVPFAPDVQRAFDGHTLTLGIKADRTSGDTVLTHWSLRRGA
jgi:hypothetical protein